MKVRFRKLSVLALALIFAFIAFAPAIKVYADNNVSYYEIDSVSKLYTFAKRVNNGERYLCAKLKKSLVINEGVLNSDGTLKDKPFREWTPIGDMNGKAYRGIFDGNGYSISGLYVQTTYIHNSAAGFFGAIYKSYIHDLTIKDSYVSCVGTYVGGIVGYADTQSLISNCKYLGTAEGRNIVGGIVGKLDSNTDGGIEDCVHAGLVMSYCDDDCVGGIVGSSDDSPIVACSNSGTVSGGSSIGGIAGRMMFSKNFSFLVGCVNTANVSAKEDQCGGIIGESTYSASNEDRAGVYFCYNTGSISAQTLLGGIKGKGDAPTYSSYSVGKVTLLDSQFDNSAIEVGGISPNGRNNYCYFDSDRYGCELNTDKDSFGKATADLKKKSTYNNWNFDEVWAINSSKNDGYPYLRENNPAYYFPCATNLRVTARTVTTLTLTWDKLRYCTGYKIYKYDVSTKKYELYKTIANNDTTTCKLTNLVSGTVYRFKIRGYVKQNNTYTYSALSNKVVAVTNLSKPKSFKAVATSTTVTLSWNSVNRATGYLVYMSNSRDGEYTRVATVRDATEYKISSLSTGKDYYFKVSAYRIVDGASYFSSTTDPLKCSTRPGKTTVRVKGAGATWIQIEWNRVSRCDGYEVYMSKNGGEFSRAATITGRDNLIYTARNLAAGSTYSFKVRAYRVVDDKKVRAYYSEIVTAKTV